MHPEEAAGLQLVGHNDLGGNGDGMQIMRNGDALYVGHFGPSGMGTSILDVSDLTAPRLVDQWPALPGTHNHKTQVADGLLLVNYERFRSEQWEAAGVAVYDVTEPFAPQRVGFFESGGAGVHRIVWEGGRYAYVSSTPDGFDERIWVIVDLSDPSHPVEAGRWWWPGQHVAGGELPEWPEDEHWNTHHAMVSGDRAYVGFWDGGLVILDISDVSRPRTISHLNWEEGGNTHTALPLEGRNLLAVTDEAVENGCEGKPHMVRLVDISDETDPQIVSICPVPQGDFCEKGLRFGAHNLHENRPGTYRSAEVLFVTYFNAGLRVYDTADPAAPVEIAHWIPECPPGQQAAQINDVLVDADHNIFVTDRVNGGLYVLAAEPELAARMEAAAL
jgi:hypothetical protein